MKTKSTLKTAADLQAALSALAETQRGRICIARFVPLAEEARYLDNSYMEQLGILFAILEEGRLNGSIVELSRKTLRNETMK